MDDIVKQAMAKWPDVPHCYGWLALDARGNWRMRDERAQAQKLAGDRITNPALVSFINRNYTHDEQGRWYFQNGPQRVYINLEATPYIVHTDPLLQFVLHTGERLSKIDGVWLTDTGQLLLASDTKIALLDDRDIGECLPALRIDDVPASENQLLDWLAHPLATTLMFELAETRLPVRHIARDAIANAFGFTANPQAKR